MQEAVGLQAETLTNRRRGKQVYYEVGKEQSLKPQIPSPQDALSRGPSEWTPKPLEAQTLR